MTATPMTAIVMTQPIAKPNERIVPRVPDSSSRSAVTPSGLSAMSKPKSVSVTKSIRGRVCPSR